MLAIRRVALGSCLVLTSSLILAIAPQAAGAPVQTLAALSGVVADQQQAIIDTSVGGLLIGGSPRQVIAQTITTGLPGLLEGVRLPLGCDVDANLTLQIQSLNNAGAPSGSVLSTETIAGSSLSGQVTGFRELALANPVNMSVGQRFAIVMSASSPNPLGGCGVFQGPIGDSYAGGDIYYQSLPNGLGNWICQCIFAGARLDLPFQTLVQAATFDSLSALTRQFVSDPGIANSMTSKLAAAESAANRGDSNAKAGALGAYINEVEAQSGKELTAAQAGMLIQFAGML